MVHVTNDKAPSIVVLTFLRFAERFVRNGRYFPCRFTMYFGFFVDAFVYLGLVFEILYSLWSKASMYDAPGIINSENSL